MLHELDTYLKLNKNKISFIQCIYRVTLNFLILSNKAFGSPLAKCNLTGSKIVLIAAATAGFRSPGCIRPDR